MFDNREDFTGQIFNRRKIIRNYCVPSDWTKIGKPIPNDTRKYRLSKCLNCGAIIPVLMKNVIERPPKRCCFCSNIRNTSTTIPSSTNTWVEYDTYAVVNVLYHDDVVQAYISIEDYKLVSSRTWRISKKKNKYYLVSGSKANNDVVYLHRFIMRDYDIPDGYEVDHIDGNSLNNRRDNLRIVTRLQNIQNMSERIDSKLGIRGVSPDGHNRYTVDFSFNNKRYYFKPWDSLEDAVFCRSVVEELFSLEMIKRNPKAKLIDKPSLQRQEEIRNYVLSKIS